MILKKWEELPYLLQTEAVRPYYDILKNKKKELLIKFTFDRVVATIMLIALAPLLLLIAVLIKLDSRGEVFFRQVRVTRYGEKFQIYKFRTMVKDAESLGTLVTTSEDMRVTKLGKKLRGCRLDELPQLINILKGEMSFVGTRPEVEKYVEQYTPEMYATLLLPAGVTSEASIEYKDEERLLANSTDADKVYVEQILPEKMKINLHSIKEFNLGMEFSTMINTLVRVLR